MAASRALTGAWIETGKSYFVVDWMVVAPSRARGLKHRHLHLTLQTEHSRALTGAWIETKGILAEAVSANVAPSRARGLKPVLVQLIRVQLIVAPSRARGLKLGLPKNSNSVERSRPHGRVD